MSTEQPSPGSEASIESRLSTVFAYEDSAPVEDKPEDQPQAEEVEASEDQEENEEVKEEEMIDFEADDGSVIKLPAAAKDAVLRRQDYTRKTEALAVQQKLASDKLQFLEAREQLSAVVQDDLVEFRSLEKELAQYKQIDWPALADANPGQHYALKEKMRDLADSVKEKRAAIMEKANGLQQATSRHQAFQWAEAEKGARQMIGNITASENVAMAQTVRNLGFTEDEFKSKASDPRLIAAIHKAAKWDALQASKSVAVETASKAPPVVKVGAVNSNASAIARDKVLSERFKKSGDFKDAAKLLMKLR